MENMGKNCLAGGGGDCLETLPFSEVIRRTKASGFDIALALDESFSLCSNLCSRDTEGVGQQPNFP